MPGGGLNAPQRRAVVVERDSSEFARLSQLGDILGLSPLEVSSVHSQLAEQAYRHQAQQARAQAPPCAAGVQQRCRPGGPSASRRGAPRAPSFVLRAGPWLAARGAWAPVATQTRGPRRVRGLAGLARFRG